MPGAAPAVSIAAAPRTTQRSGSLATTTPIPATSPRRLWRAHWAEFTPFLAFPPEVRRVIYTTNLIESMNARLRKVTRNRGQFPSEQAALKVLYLAVRNLQDYRGPNTGIRSSGWKQALQAFTIYFDGRIPTP
jgi:transposase-like protein